MVAQVGTLELDYVSTTRPRRSDRDEQAPATAMDARLFHQTLQQLGLGSDVDWVDDSAEEFDLAVDEIVSEVCWWARAMSIVSSIRFNSLDWLSTVHEDVAGMSLLPRARHGDKSCDIINVCTCSDTTNVLSAIFVPIVH